jgi:imidazolonepropionase-like amidohydrolase
MQENGHSMAFPGIPVASVELQTAVIEAAHKHGLLALAHATNLDETLLVLKAGVDALTHSFSDKLPTPELTEAFKRNNAFLIPTLAVVSSLTGEEQELRDKFAAKATPEQLTDPVKKNMVACLKLRVEDATIKNAYAQIKQLKAAGIDIVAGTDSVPGLLGTAIGPSFAQELYMYVERCGFSPVEALHSATALPAKRFGFKDRGRVAEGLRADLLLVKGDPTSNIEDICNVAGVWKAGQISFEPKA